MTGQRPVSSRTNRQLRLERMERRDLLSGLVGLENGFAVSDVDSSELTVEIRVGEVGSICPGSVSPNASGSSNVQLDIPTGELAPAQSKSPQDENDANDREPPVSEMKIGPVEPGMLEGMKFTDPVEPPTTSMTEKTEPKRVTSTLPFSQWRVVPTPQQEGEPWAPAPGDLLYPDELPIGDPIEVPGPKVSEGCWTPTHRDRDLAFQEEDLLPPTRPLDVEFVDPPKQADNSANNPLDDGPLDKKIKSPEVDPFAAETAGLQAKIEFIEGVNEGPKGQFAPAVLVGITMWGAESQVHRVMSLSNNTLGQLAIALARMNSRDPLVSQLRHLVRLEIRRRFGAEFLPLY